MKLRPRDLHQIPPEATPDGESLVELDIAGVAVDIDNLFAAPDTPPTIGVANVAILLRTPADALALATITAGHFDIADFASLKARINAGKGSRKYKYDAAMAHELNVHPYIRTFSRAAVAQMLDVRFDMITETADALDITPAVKKGIIPTTEGAGHGSERYNKDQIVHIREGLKRYDAPEGYVAESMILSATGLSPEALYKIINQLNIEPPIYRNPAAGRSGERHLSSQDTARLLNLLRVQGYRPTPKST